MILTLTSLRLFAPSEEFPPVTTTVSVLGASMSIGPVFSRFFFRQPTPIADAFSSNIMPQLKRCGVKRILSLSTPTAMYSESERKSMGWKWWLYSFLPLVLAPQGNAEMKGIAENIIVDAGEDVEWTVFRVPTLDRGPRQRSDCWEVGWLLPGKSKSQPRSSGILAHSRNRRKKLG